MRASVFYKQILFHNLMNKFKNVERELDLEYESITLNIIQTCYMVFCIRPRDDVTRRSRRHDDQVGDYFI